MKLRVIFLLIFILSGYLAFSWWTSQLAPPLPGSDKQVNFVVPPRQTAAATIQNLRTLGLIKSPFAAKLYLKYTGLDQRLRPGSYLLSPGTDLSSQIATLAAGPKDIWLTFPEGWRREQIAVRLQASLKDFDTPAFLSQTASLEGQLFPDTYLIPPQATVSNIISFFLNNFSKKSGLDLSTQYPISFPSQSTFTISGSQIITLASLVEREARYDADRPTIAGIFLKRLNSDWPLQVDATVQYARDTQSCKPKIDTCKFWEPIFDTKFISPYNTYLHPGLPPTPIANPGLASITAVLHPQHTDYWFYLTGLDGVTYYARTIQEHQANIDKYLRL